MNTYKNFKKFGLSENIQKNLFLNNLKAPTWIQSQSIPLISSGNNVIISSKTGSGKTLSYLIPLLNTLETHNTTFGARLLILIPSRELAKQVASTVKYLIKRTNLSYSIIVGGHDYEGQFESIASNPDILICTPGRLLDLVKSIGINLRSIEHLVIDEADLMLNMGLLQQIKGIIKETLKVKQTIFVTATLPDEVSRFGEICNFGEFKIICSPTELGLPDNLVSHFLIMSPELKLPTLLHILVNYIKDENCIIFVSSRYIVDYFEAIVNKFSIYHNFRISFMHGNMDMELRNSRLEEFKSNNNNILLVTDLCARGIDIPDVKYIINYDFPNNLKTFLHRCGRTARINKKGYCITLLENGEEAFIHELSYKFKKEIKNNHDIIVNNFNDDSFDPKQLYVGIVTYDIVSKLKSQINIVKDLIDDYEQLEISLKNSIKKTNKLQEKPSQKSILLSKKNHIIKLHPVLLTDLSRNSADVENMLKNIKQYKSNESYLYTKILPDDKKMNIDFLKEKESDINSKKIIKKELNDNITNAYNNITKYDKSKLLDWKVSYEDSKYYIKDETDIDNVNKTLENSNLDRSQIKSIMLSNDNNDETFIKKKVWDSYKKKYKQVEVNLNGDINNEKNIRIKKNAQKDNKKLTKIYNNWKSINNISIQKVGEKEDNNLISKAKNQFTNRKKNKFKINNKEINNKGKTIKKEFKNFNELLKLKKSKLKKKLKNMPKNIRKSVINKNKKKNNN